MADPQAEPDHRAKEPSRQGTAPGSVPKASERADRVQAFVWGTPHADAQGNVPQVERALAVVRGLAILGLAPLLVFGGVAGYCSTNCGDGTALTVFRGASVALLAAAAAYAAGALLGFLFGMPRLTDASSGNPPAPRNEAKTPPTAQKPQTAEPPAAQPASSGRVRPNTGLERIMDWLTTLIVGLGLVHIRTAVEYGTSISAWVTAAIVDGKVSPDMNAAPGAAILLPYSIAGFFLVYLWAQRYMGRELLMADMESNAAIVAAFDKKQKETLIAVAGVAEQMLNRRPGSGLPGAAAPQDPLAGLDAGIAKEIAERYARSSDYFYEPMEAFGAQESNWRRIEADVVPMAGKMNLFRITLRVRTLDPKQRPMPGPVVFFLHHTFAERYLATSVVEGVATLTLISAGSFVAGAAIVGETTRLALDLAKLPGVPQEFVEN